ncbi:MAG: hypothetical protein WCX22_03505 [Methanoregula sp.]|jgi:hypothetical protein
MESQTKKRFLIIGIVTMSLVLLLLYFQWNGIQDGQSTLNVYPVTLYPNGSGTAFSLSIDKILIENATHLTDKDFAEHPALAEVLTHERSLFRGFSKMSGVDPGEEEILRKKYYISEYKGDYYLMLVMRH